VREGAIFVTIGFLMLAAAGAIAAVTVTSSSTITTSVTPPPVQFAAGAGSTNTRYVGDYSLSTNATSFEGTFKGRAGGDATVKNVTQIRNTMSVSQTVTLSATQVTNPRVTAFTWTVKDASTTIGTLDHKATSPILTFTIPAGMTYTMNERLKVAGGSGNNNGDSADVSATLGLSAS